MKTAIACLVAFVLSFAAVVAYGAEPVNAPIGAPVAVLADPAPVDLAAAMPAPVQVAVPVVIVGTRPAPRAAVWTCGAPVALASDEIATVRHCEWR